MTIKELTYLLLDMVNGGIPTDDSKLNYRVAKAYVKSAVAFFLKRKIFDEKNAGESNFTSESNTVTKEVAVLTDPNGVKYVELLGESIDLGGMRSYQVAPVNMFSRWNLTFVPQTQNEMFNQGLLTNIPDVIQYVKKGSRLYFKGIIPSDLVTVNLTQSSLVPSDDDDVVPSDIISQSVEYAFRLAQPEIAIPQDLSNDGVASNGTTN